MRTFSTHTSHLRGHRPRAIVLSVGDESGIDDAVAFLTTVTELSCPVVVCPTPDIEGRLHARLASIATAPCEDGRRLDEAAIWILPAGQLVTVHQDRWELTPHPAADHDAQVGRLCSSLKASYRSRVFLICTGHGLERNPLVRLLVQRGAPLVETRDRPGRGLADHAPVNEIVAHLEASVGIIRKASA